MRLLRDPLVRAWLALVALSGASTVLASHRGAGALAAILLFAGIKARLVLARYLGLEQVAPVRRGFDLLLGALLVVMGVLLAMG